MVFLFSFCILHMLTISNVCFPGINFIAGDPRVDAVNIIWTGPDATSWVSSPGRTLKGELALEVFVQKVAARKNGDAWRIVLDACLPVIHLIDTTRSIPYGIQQIKGLLGISCAFDQSVQVS